MAAHFGSVAMVKQLLDAEVNVVDGQNELGYTPLHQAAQQGHSQIVNLLLETGKASPNTVSNVSWISIELLAQFFLSISQYNVGNKLSFLLKLISNYTL